MLQTGGQYVVKNLAIETGRMAQWLRAFLAEDQGSVSSTHTGTHNHLSQMFSSGL